MREERGSPKNLLDFFDTVHAQLVLLLVSATSAVIGTDLENVNYRMCDYTPELAAKSDAARCGAHLDYGTMMLVFQYGNRGFECQSPDGEWVAVSGSDVFVFWRKGVRRNTAVMFVASDVPVPLMPLVDQDAGRSFVQSIVNVGYLCIRESIQYSPTAELVPLSWFH
ncbi:hypothetical protein BCR44DRAFT_1514285 [Catenaria anguillulae PL171]|uniref:Isopenicillin N synthase-like Fe(2+) 2OG dioxygenase domain-containing protein n=1 Tax=Catenaria anguillulae PL171 TaxID=765915 RepID=A0A1Y2HHK5_9FUNG|nr:hypothetical protein BCR44DRAFT_1514285 [Catenaria anguillulae PL171]